MKKKFISLLIFVLLIPSSPNAMTIINLERSEALESYYQNLYLGERKTRNYGGPSDPRANFDEESGDLRTLDDQFSIDYLNDQTEREVFNLQNFWFKKVIEKSTCPDVTLGENVEYIRYLYRLLTISYLFESLKINYKTISSIGGNKKSCALSFHDIFGACTPRTEDMKKFYKRVEGKLFNEIPKIQTQFFNKQEKEDWFSNFKRSTSLTIDPIYARLHVWCHGQKKNCKNITLNEVKKALGGFCNDDRSLIQNLCSESDGLYGISYVNKASELIKISNAFNLLNHSGAGEECLRRYVKIFSPKENYYGVLAHQFPLIYSHLIRENSRYLQGELFLPGALKEFDMKGLSDFLTALKPPKVEAILKVLSIHEPKVVSKPVEAEVKNKSTTIPVKLEPVQMEVVVPPKPRISEFENAVLEFEGKTLESFSLNMENFRDDFEFTQQMVADLAIPIRKFQTRAALNDMKSFDSLGSINAPLGLIFLKYLIDTENHQGLYNITSIIGNKFYVYNDIEKKNRPVLIELKNDASTQNRWQIILTKKMAIKSKN